MTVALQIKVNGGAPQTGHVVATDGDIIQPTAAKSGWDSTAPALWEIRDYATGWACPAGWTEDATTHVYFYLGNSDPPAFTVAGGQHYVTNLSATESGRRTTDESTGLDVPDQNGFANIGAYEGARFGSIREGLAGPVKALFARMEAGGTGDVKGITALGSVTGAQAFDGATANIVSLTATGNITLTLSNLETGKDYSIDFTQDATGGRTLTLAGFTELVAGSFLVDPAPSVTTVLTFRVIRAAKVMLSQPPTSGILTNAVRASAVADLSIVGGAYESLGAGCVANVHFDFGRCRTSGGATGAIVITHPQGFTLLDLQAFGTRGTTDSLGYLRYGWTSGAKLQIGTVDCIMEAVSGADWWVDLLHSASRFIVRNSVSAQCIEVSATGLSVCAGSSEANQNQALRLGAVSAPSGSPTSGCYVWWDGTALTTRDPTGAACDFVVDVITCSSIVIPTTATFTIGSTSRLGDIDIELGTPGVGVDSGKHQLRANGAVKHKTYWHGGLTAWLDWYTDTTYIMAGGTNHLSDDNANKKFSWSSSGIAYFGHALAGQVGDMGALTDSTTGTADGTVSDVGAAFSQSAINNNFKELVVKINLLRDFARTHGAMA